ncbi:MAG: TPM domain-containing protein [Gemmatimonadales bacterium]|jgi:uncharacterized protein
MPFLALVALLLQLQIPAPTGYVNDFAHVIDPASRARMEAVIDRVRAASGGEIVIVTLPDLGGREPIDVGRDIGRQWKVGAQGAAGDQRRNTGVVLLLVPGAHPGDGKARLAIATGTGAEGFVTDALAGRIRDAIGRQSVSAGSYAAGLVTGAELLAQAYAGEFGFKLADSLAPALPPPVEQPSGRISGRPFFNLFVIVVLLFVLGGLGRRRRGLGSGLLEGMIIGSVLGGGHRGGWGGGGFGGGGFGGFGGGGGFGGFGGGGGFSGGGASGGF